jgi:HEAT repeat protein
MRGRAQIVCVALLLIGGVFVVTLVVVKRMFSDTIEKRIRVNTELGALRDRLQYNPTDREALTNLILALSDPYRFKRVRAASCLGHVGPAAKDAVPALAHALKGNEMFLSGAAALALSELGPDARGAIPELIEASQSGNGTTAWNAIKALSNMQSDAATVVPALIKCLDGVGDPLPDGGTVGPELAIEASNALAKFGPQAREALIPLKSKLNTSSGKLRSSLLRAIRFIDPEDASLLE